jgi:inositol transport system ATP-binding protein
MAEEFVLRVRDVSKRFPGVQALDGVHLDIARGEVHALTGENGAGKSTLMKILIGMHAPDAGEIFFRGRPVRLKNTHDALRLGISMIHQELLPFPDLTVAENICMGREPTRWFPGWLDKAAMHREAEALLARLGVAIPPGSPMNRLSVAATQAVEIAKALAYNAEVIIMDEPTSALSAREVEALFTVITDLKRRGVAIIYISHKLDEILRMADAVTVLRDGRHVATCRIGEVDEQRLIALMVGRALTAPSARSAGPPGAAALEVRGLTSPGKFRDVSFTVRRGEILGIAGLMGAGRTELGSAIFGLAPAASGEILVDCRPLRIAHPGDALAGGIAMVTEDRKRFGVVPRMTVKHNLTLASLDRCCRGGFIDHAAESRIAAEQMRAFSIRAAGSGQQAVSLSGGNQQKVVIAKALLTAPEILILDEPTRGIDIGAKSEIYGIIRRLAQAGKAVIMISSEMSEILALSDRILVMRAGAISAEFATGEATPEAILKYAMAS